MSLPGALKQVKRPLAVPALQQPEWPDNDHLREVCERLAASVGPVDVPSCRSLADELARAGSGEAFVITGGDCAERFHDATPDRVIAKANYLHRIADEITNATGIPTTRIGRFGGQFAKPRSQAYEEMADGQRVLSYRGDAVNGLGPHQRRPDPARLLVAHERTGEAVQALREWDLRRPYPRLRRCRAAPVRTYLGHEALILDYEKALLRDGGRHASSGHYLWIGDRTRHPDHAHVAFAASVQNPVGVKLGPSVEPGHVQALVDVLHPGHEHRPGRLSLIVRMGAARCATLLPKVIDAVGPRATDVLWILDPMHGNVRVNAHGQKTRLLIDIIEEIRIFFAVVSRRGLWPAGIHLEMTPDDVTECVESAKDLTLWLPAYRSACDPRLNPAQAAVVAEVLAGLVHQSGPSGFARSDPPSRGARPLAHGVVATRALHPEEHS